MMSITHAAIATSAVSISLGTGDSFVLATALIASQFPDLDKTDSFIGRALFPVARYIEERYAHRTITHSFLSSGALAIASLPLCLLHWHYWAAVNLGHFTGWFADCFTKMGVCAFYPSPVRLVIPGNPRARISSGSTWEYWVLAIAAFLAVVSVNLASAGGITEQFARAFFPDTTTAARLFERYGAEQVVSIDVIGLHNHTSQAIASRYTVLEVTSTDLIAQEELSGKLYKIGGSPDAQIRPTRVQTSLGDRLTLTAHELVLQEIGVEQFTSQIPADAYVSGSLLLDDINDVQIAASFEAFDPIRLWAGQVELRNARPEAIAQHLSGQWIVQGKVIVKERRL